MPPALPERRAGAEPAGVAGGGATHRHQAHKDPQRDGGRDLPAVMRSGYPRLAGWRDHDNSVFKTGL